MSYRSLGQTDTTPVAPATPVVPLAVVVGGIAALVLFGARQAERHQRSLYANKRRRRKR